ncbi:acyltransferase family protein [Nonomuraea sp. NPDC050328]|uniref:acyltransferase family protein n=1 Tax=Nonomuraea sp. NPDC050328 TaxID=3364361 RepID=UPI00379123D5
MTVTAVRMAHLDRVRVLLTVLVVLHHVALTYGSFPLWYHHEPDGSGWGRLLDLFMLLNQTFAMGLFFLISGYFLPGAVERRGRWRVLGDRAVRLGVPLLLIVFVVVPLAKLPGYLRAPQGGYLDFYLRELEQGPGWFLAALLLFTAAYVLLHRPPGERPGSPLRARTLIGFALALVVLGVAWRVAQPLDRVPLVQFPVPAYLPQYVGMFAAGVLAWRRGWLTEWPARAAGWGFGAAAVAVVALVPLTLDGSLLARVAHGIFDGVYGVGMSVGVLALFAHRFAGPPTALGRFLAANAYTVYVLHAVVLVAVSVALSGLDVGPLAKFVLVGAVSVPLCWALAAIVRGLSTTALAAVVRGVRR